MNETLECLTATKQNENPAAAERTLPSGRSVLLKVVGENEELEVRSPAGDIEVRISLGSEGAVVRLHAARLELESPDAVTVNCRRFSVNSTEGTDLTSEGDLRITGREMRVRTESDIHLNGGIIHLNC